MFQGGGGGGNCVETKWRKTKWRRLGDPKINNWFLPCSHIQFLLCSPPLLLLLLLLLLLFQPPDKPSGKLVGGGGGGEWEGEADSTDSTDSTDSADEAPVRVRRLRLGRRRKRGSAIRTSGFSPGKSTAGYQCCHLPSKPPTNPLNTEKPCRRKKKKKRRMLRIYLALVCCVICRMVPPCRPMMAPTISLATSTLEHEKDP